MSSLNVLVLGSSGFCRECWIDGVAILAEMPAQRPGGFFPDPLFVVTSNVSELSWLFEELRNIAVEFNEFNQWKGEFFSRLVVRTNTVPATVPVEDLLFATLWQAYELLGILEIGMTMHDCTPVIVNPRAVGAEIQPFDLDLLESFFGPEVSPFPRGLGFTCVASREDLALLTFKRRRSTLNFENNEVKVDLLDVLINVLIVLNIHELEWALLE